MYLNIKTTNTYKINGFRYTYTERCCKSSILTSSSFQEFHFLVRSKIVIYATRCEIENYIMPVYFVRMLFTYLSKLKTNFFQDCSGATAKRGREFAAALVQS